MTAVHHTCHAHGCTQEVPAKKFACAYHWRNLSIRMQRAILREYVPDQEITKTPTLRYLAVQRLAVAKLAFRPWSEEAACVMAVYLAEAQKFREDAIAAGFGDPLWGLVPS